MYGYFACEHGTLLSFTTKGVIQGTALGLEGPEGTLDPLSECASLLSLSSIISFLYNNLTSSVNTSAFTGIGRDLSGRTDGEVRDTVRPTRPAGSALSYRLISQLIDWHGCKLFSFVQSCEDFSSRVNPAAL